MARTHISTDEFKRLVKSADAPSDAVVVASATEGQPKPVGDRRIRFVFSTGETDRVGDTVNPHGWDLSAFKRNPIAIYGHDTTQVENIIGKAMDVGVVGDRLVGTIQFAPGSINPKAQMCYELVRGGYLNACSVGFRPTQFKFADKSRPPGSMDFLRQELMEISLCAVPALPSALAMRSMGSKAKTDAQRKADQLIAEAVRIAQSWRRGDDDVFPS